MKIVIPGHPRSMGKGKRSVLFLILVDEAGSVVEEGLMEWSGLAAVDGLAADAVRQTRFIPARQKEKPIRAWTRYEVSFRKDG